MTTKSLIGVMGALCVASLAWGQAVPSQTANIQQGSKSGANGGNNVQVQYDLDHWGYNQSEEAFMQFDMSVFPASLTASAVQKATLVLYLNNGGNPGTISICQVAQAWSAATITGTNAPACANTAAVTFTVSAAELQQGSFISVDITHIVQGWLASGNYGVALVPQAPTYGNGVNVQFSSMQGNPGYPPTLDLVLQGSGGGTGTQGATGPQGSTGAPGAQGPQGIAGAAGPAGAAGAKGATGTAGAPGANGAAGATGSAGAAGAKGATGAAGATGVAGPAGATGAAGPAGATGPSGAQGLQGVPGALGPTGVQGPTGAQGSAGPTGAPGVAGPAGATGAPGTAGINGVNGVPGATGAQGAPGTGGGLLLSTTVTISDDQYQALGNTPITIVQPQGVGQVILPVAMAMYVPGASSYASTLSFRMAGTDLYDWNALPPSTSNFISLAGNFFTAQGAIFGSSSTFTNQGITVQTNPVLGSGQGLVITVWYFVWTTPTN